MPWQLFCRGVLRSDPSLPCCSRGAYCPRVCRLGSAGGLCRGGVASCRDWACLVSAFLVCVCCADRPGHRYWRRCGIYTASLDSRVSYARRVCERRCGELGIYLLE